MRRYNLSILFVLVGGCASFTAGGKNSAVAPFTSKDAVDNRIKEIISKSEVAKNCPSKTAEADKGGVLEVTAAADGKLSARQVDWKGDPSVGACIVAEAAKVTLAPLAGPPVSTLWIFAQTFPNPGPLPDNVAARYNDFKNKVNDEIIACGNRYLPPEFPANISLQFNIVPGGKVVAVNVVGSTAKDGDFETCTQQALAKMEAPDMQYAGPYPMQHSMHIGPLEKH